MKHGTVHMKLRGALAPVINFFCIFIIFKISFLSCLVTSLVLTVVIAVLVMSDSFSSFLHCDLQPLPALPCSFQLVGSTEFTKILWLFSQKRVDSLEHYVAIEFRKLHVIV
jgi:hypothetical protein